LRAAKVFKGALINCQIDFLEKFLLKSEDGNSFQGFGFESVRFTLIENREKSRLKVSKWIGRSESVILKDFVYSTSNWKDMLMIHAVVDGAVKEYSNNVVRARELITVCCERVFSGFESFDAVVSHWLFTAEAALARGAFDLLDWLEKENYISYCASGLMGANQMRTSLDFQSKMAAVKGSTFYAILDHFDKKGVNFLRSLPYFGRVLVDRNQKWFPKFNEHISVLSYVKERLTKLDPEEVATIAIRHPPSDLNDFMIWKKIIVDFIPCFEQVRGMSLFTYVMTECLPWLTKEKGQHSLLPLVDFYRDLASLGLLPPKNHFGDLYRNLIFHSYDVDFSPLIDFLATYDCLHPIAYVNDIRALISDRLGAPVPVDSSYDQQIITQIKSTPSKWDQWLLREILVRPEEEMRKTLGAIVALQDPRFQVTPSVGNLVHLLDSFQEKDLSTITDIFDMFTFGKGSKEEEVFFDLIFNRYGPGASISFLSTPRRVGSKLNLPFVPNSQFLVSYIMAMVENRTGHFTNTVEQVSEKVGVLLGLGVAFPEDLLLHMIDTIDSKLDSDFKLNRQVSHLGPLYDERYLLHIVKALRDLGCPWNDRTFAALMKVSDAYPALLDFFHEKNCPFSDIVALAAIKKKERDGDDSAMNFLEQFDYDIYCYKVLVVA